MSKTKEVKEMIISNFIEHYTTIENQRDDMMVVLETYIEEDHVDEIGQAFPSTVMSVRDGMVEKLGHYVSDDADESYDKLLNQESIDGDVMADDIVLMWEPLEDRYTVSQLLDEIT
jgi:hypothetical protein